MKFGNANTVSKVVGLGTFGSWVIKMINSTGALQKW